MVSVLYLADFGEFLLQRKLVQLLDRQAHEQLDAPRQLLIGLAESGAFGLVAALDMRRVGNPPVRGGRLARPDRAGLARRVVAHGEKKIDLWRTGGSEIVPALASEPRNAVPLLQ